MHTFDPDPIREIRVRFGTPAVEKTFRGREGWALNELLRAGKEGLTTLSRPAPRWSHYVFQLRRAGIDISTDYARHVEPYAGSHGIYKLQEPVEVLERVYAI